MQHLLLHYRNARSCNLHHYLNVCISTSSVPTAKAAASSNSNLPYAPYEQSPVPRHYARVATQILRRRLLPAATATLRAPFSTISSTDRGCHTRTKTACCQQQLQPTRHGLALSIAAPKPKEHHRICATAAPKDAANSKCITTDQCQLQPTSKAVTS